jgi:haloalkane dehalogenase
MPRGQPVESAPDYEAFAQFDVTLHGYRMHYVDVGGGPPVVLVHGSPLSSYAFRHQIAALSPRFRVIAPDLLGFGRSETPKGGASFLQQSQVLRALFDHLDLDSFRLLVHDWGGPIGVGAVADRLERVRQLVLLNTTLRKSFRPPWYWKPFTAAGTGDLLLVRLKLFSRGLPLMLHTAKSRPVRQYYAQALEAEDTCRTILALERQEGFEAVLERVEDAVRDIGIPMLILWGQPDPYFRQSELEQLKRMFPHAIVREIERGGHFSQEDAPETVTRELLAFLR